MIWIIFKWLVIGFIVAVVLFYFFCIFMMGDLTKREQPKGYNENCKRFFTMLRNRK